MVCNRWYTAGYRWYMVRCHLYAVIYRWYVTWT